MACKFSIIVPVYGVESYIEQCVNSLINQTYHNFEIILVDDGSIDNCPQICDQFAENEPRVKVIHKTNGGLVSARKAGAEIATGEYILCVDGDDWVHRDCLAVFAQIVDKYQPDLICSGYYSASPSQVKQNSPKMRQGFYDKGSIVKDVFPMLIQKSDATYFPPSLWAKAFKRELYVFEQLKVSNEIRIGEDGACIIPIAYNANSLYVTTSAIYYYRVNLDSMTKNRKAFDWYGPLLIDQHLRSRIDARLFDFEEQMCRKLTHELFTVVVSQFYRNDGYSDIIKDIKEKLKISVYQDAVDKSVFRKSLKAMMMSSALKRGWMLPIYLYSKLKR